MQPLLSWRNLADAAETIAATREAPGLGVRNLLTESPSEPWRVPVVAAGTVTDVDVSFGAEPILVDLIALFADRASVLPDATTVQLFGSNVSLGASDTLAVASAPLSMTTGLGCWRHVTAAPVFLRFLRLRFVATAPDGYLQLGRLWVGPALRPALSYERVSLRRGAAGAGSVERAAVSGVPSVVRGAKWRLEAFALPNLTAAEAAQVRAMALAAGTDGQVVMQASTAEGAAGMILGRCLTAPAPAQNAARRWRADFQIAEDI